MMIIGLDEAEILCIARLKSIIAIQLKKRCRDEICACRCNEFVAIRPFVVAIYVIISAAARSICAYVKRLINSKTAVIKRLIDLGHNVSLGDKDEFFDGMIEIRLNIHLILEGCHGDKRSVLHLLNEVFVAFGDKATTFLYV